MANKWIGIGRLTRDPEVRTGSTTVARYTLAVDRKYKKDGDDQTADFIPCVAFGKSAELAEKYFKKGLKIAVEGHIQTGSYTDKEGKKIYTTDIIVESQEFVESKRDESSPTESAPDEGFVTVPDDDELPFQ